MLPDLYVVVPSLFRRIDCEVVEAILICLLFPIEQPAVVFNHVRDSYLLVASFAGPYARALSRLFPWGFHMG